MKAIKLSNKTILVLIACLMILAAAIILPSLARADAIGVRDCDQPTTIARECDQPRKPAPAPIVETDLAGEGGA